MKGKQDSPTALVVEEEDEEEFLFGPVLHPLSGPEHVQWGCWDGNSIVMAAPPHHLGVYYLDGNRRIAVAG